MKTYKYTDSTNTVVHVIDEDGKSRCSMLVTALKPGTTILPADLNPNARKEEIKERLTQIDKDSIRSLRAKVTGKGNTQDDTKLTALEDEAALLRAELATL